MATFNKRNWHTDGIIRDDRRRIGQEAKRQSVKYSPSENEDLLAQFVLGFSVQEIAEWHERSINGVSLQLTRLGAFDEACFCDKNNLGVRGVTCGDCPKDYEPRKKR